MKGKTPIALMFILMKIVWVDSHCTSFEVTTTKEHNYLSDYGQLRCCKTVKSTLYKYVECEQTTLETGHKLAIGNAPTETSFKYIVFDNSTIPLIPIGVFASFTTLTELYLNSTSVKTIHPGALSGLTKLEELYLQGNDIKKIDRGTLNSLGKLKTLNLSNNNLEEIEDNALLGLFALKNLVLNHNRLTNFNPNIFDSLNNLAEADLSHNELLGIKSPLFSKTTQLVNLDLSFNNLTDFDFSFVPKSLKTFNLSNNQIATIENLDGLYNIDKIDLSHNEMDTIEAVHNSVRYLDVSWNKITELNFSTLQTSTELLTLDLSHNLISNLSEDSLAGWSSLKYLHLQNNYVDNIAIGSFRNLHLVNSMNLSSNLISDLEFGTFGGLTSLEILDISNNQLKFLFESAFHTLKNLQVLNIEQNFISSFDASEFAGHLNKFKAISLNNNPWNCKSLLTIVKVFAKTNITISKGTAQKVENIYGIACFNNKYTDEGSTPKPIESAVIFEELQALSELLRKNILNTNSANTQNFKSEKIFDQELKRYFEDGLTNTSFYKLLQQNFSNTIFFRSTNETFSKLFKNIDRTLENSTFYTTFLSQNFSKRFVSEFEGSDFYKSFVQYFQESIQHLKGTNLLLTSIQTYFDTEFKNFTALSPEKSAELLTNYSAFSHHLSTDDVLFKISELKRGNNLSNVMIVFVALLLLVIVIIITIKFNKYQVTKNKINSADMVGDGALELI